MGRRVKSMSTPVEKIVTAHIVAEPPPAGAKDGHTFNGHITNAPGLLCHSDSAAPAADGTRNCFTYCGPDAGPDPQKRLHQEFKALSKEERQRIAAESAQETDVIARTVHLRFLPTGMLQSELAALCAECGEYLRVRICGNSSNTQNWIYGFVEFADRRGAQEMMRRSGMELPNGHGKPPLRLKCNAAKQPIVDRVFHDADLEGNVSCIFGSGNFAHRTLKEAVDSYYNLKRKEGNLSTAQPRANNSSQTHNGCGWASKHSNGGSHHAQDHHRNSHHHNNTNGNGKGRQTSLTHIPLDRHNWIPFAPQRSATADQCSPSNSLLGAESPSVISQLQPSLGRAEAPAVNDVDVSSFLSTLFPQTPVSDFAKQVDNGVGHGAYNVDFSRCNSSLSPLLGFTSTHNGVSLSPQRTELRQQVDCGCALVFTAVSHAQAFIDTGERFHEAVNALRRLYDHTVSSTTRDVLGNFSNVGSGELDDGMEVPRQRLLQLRLLACLLLSLLYSLKDNCEEMLRAVRNAVLCCNIIPVAPLRRKTTAASAERMETPNATRDWCNIIGNRDDGRRSSDSDNQNDYDDATLAVGFEKELAEDAARVFNPLAHVLDPFGDVSIDPETAASEGRQPLSTAASSPRGVPEAAYHRLVQFHSYVLNVLLTIGFAVESTQPVVARCVYVLAHRRAKELFGEVPGELERTLDEGGAHRLRPALLQEVSESAFVKTLITTFDVASAMSAGEGLWLNLLPEHVVRVFGAEQQHIARKQD